MRHLLQIDGDRSTVLLAHVLEHRGEQRPAGALEGAGDEHHRLRSIEIQADGHRPAAARFIPLISTLAELRSTARACVDRGRGGGDRVLGSDRHAMTLGSHRSSTAAPSTDECRPGPFRDPETTVCSRGR